MSLKDVAPVKPKLPSSFIPPTTLPTINHLITNYSVSPNFGFNISQSSSSYSFVKQPPALPSIAPVVIRRGSDANDSTNRAKYSNANGPKEKKEVKQKVARPSILRKKRPAPKVERLSPPSPIKQPISDPIINESKSALASRLSILSVYEESTKPGPSITKRKFPPPLNVLTIQKKITLEELAGVINATSKLISEANVSSSKEASDEGSIMKSKSPIRFPSQPHVDDLPPPAKTMRPSEVSISFQRKKTPIPEHASSCSSKNNPFLPADTRKQLFVSIPSTSSKQLPASISIQPSRRNSKAIEASFAFDNDPSSPQSVGSPVYSPSDFPPRQPDFDYSSFREGDVILVDRSELGDGLRKASIIYVNKEYSSSSQYFQGELIVLKPAAQKRCEGDSGNHTVYYVHYARLDRRMDEWIDIHEIHSAVDKPMTPASSQPRGSFVMTDLSDSPTKKTRSQKKKAEEFQHNEKAPIDYGATIARCEEKHEKATMLKNIDSIQIGDNVVRCWYFSPYPTKALAGRHLYICEFCLSYFSSGEFFQLHTLNCTPKPPPGEIVYADEKNSFAVYEVIGAQNRFYCQSLCLLSKLFLDHKTLYYHVDTFYFYVICEIDSNGWPRLVGHFSKENYSMNNLACIMVLPPYQRKGYGKFLIQLSYVFSCRERYLGTPEKPLSDLGKVSYRGYWWWLLVNYIEHEIGCEEDISIPHLQRVAGITADDIISTFEPIELIKNFKGEMYISMSPQILRFCKSLPIFAGPKLLLDVDLVHWTERYLPLKAKKNDNVVKHIPSVVDESPKEIKIEDDQTEDTEYDTDEADNAEEEDEFDDFEDDEEEVVDDGNSDEEYDEEDNEEELSLDDEDIESDDEPEKHA